ncbi:hypothetical protein [Streptomyces longwoodensis]|uniref:hypothetical protein n=1 Tax=Streptomyces longwoodensis TaxID=68231 RepID=UPI0036E76AD9
MTTYSQTPEALPPETPATTSPASQPAADRFATFDLALPVPAGSAPSAPDAVASPVAAAEGVLSAAQRRGLTTPEELAKAEAEAGILFDPKVAQDIAEAAAAQAHAEDEAEIAERGRQLAEMAGTLRQRTAVVRLLEGRPGTDLLTVAEIAAAVEYGTTPYDDLPMTIRWTGVMSVDKLGRLVLRCESPYGGRADLVVDGPDRTHFATASFAAPQPAAAVPDVDGRAESGAPDGVARCVRCGCTEEQACDGGCAWVSNRQMVELCSACATPEELAAAGWQIAGGQ